LKKNTKDRIHNYDTSLRFVQMDITAAKEHKAEVFI